MWTHIKESKIKFSKFLIVGDFFKKKKHDKHHELQSAITEMLYFVVPYFSCWLTQSSRSCRSTHLFIWAIRTVNLPITHFPPWNTCSLVSAQEVIWGVWREGINPSGAGFFFFLAIRELLNILWPVTLTYLCFCTGPHSCSHQIHQGSLFVHHTAGSQRYTCMHRGKELMDWRR